MKSLAFVVIVLVAGVTATAVPDFELRSNERFLGNIIEKAIEDVSTDLKERGLDPYEQEAFLYEYILPVTDLLLVDTFVGEVLIKGISDIKIHRINYSVLLQRLQMDISLPHIFANIGPSSANIKFFSSHFNGKFSGSLEIEDVRIKIDMRINIGLISGITVRSLSADFDIHNIKSDIELFILGYDFSKHMNLYFGEILPHTLKEHSEQINKLLEYIVKQAVEDAL